MCVMGFLALIPARNTHKRVKVFSFLLLLLLVQILQTHAYVDWLKCYLELDDEEEVIMHNPIVHHSNQSEDQRQVTIEIQPYVSTKGASWLTTTPQDTGELFGTVSSPALLKVRLRIPPSLRQKRSFQFVVEAKGEGVSFLGDGVMCDGKRAFSKTRDDHVLLQLTETSSHIELFAGWAAGYEAVKLTKKMVLKRSSNDETTVENGDEL